MASKEKGKQQVQGKADKNPPAPTKMTFKPLKIDKWDGSAVKNALDDTAKKILTEELGCVEDFGLIDKRLGICTVGVLFAATALLYDYFVPFPASKVVMAACAVSYFVMMGILTLYSMYVEGNTFLVGREKDEAGLGADNVWRLGSTLPRFSHMYSLTAQYTNGKTKESKNNTIEKSVAEWFDKEGNLVTERFFSDVKNLVSSINKNKTD